MNLEELQDKELGRRLVMESVLESMLAVLIQEDPNRLARLRSRLDDYRPKARSHLPGVASEVFEERVERLLLDLEQFARHRPND